MRPHAIRIFHAESGLIAAFGEAAQSLVAE